MQTTRARRQTARPAIESAPRWARWFVWSFLTMVVTCGAVGIEAWPLTGFRLFSHLRHERQIDWQAFAVGPDGREAWLPLSRFPGGYNGLPLVMKGFASRPPRERAEMCRAWTVAAHGLRGETAAIRIYEIDRRLEPRHGRRPMIPPKRTLVQTCAGRLELKGTTNASD